MGANVDFWADLHKNNEIHAGFRYEIVAPLGTDRTSEVYRTQDMPWPSLFLPAGTRTAVLHACQDFRNPNPRRVSDSPLSTKIFHVKSPLSEFPLDLGIWRVRYAGASITFAWFFAAKC